MTTCPFRAEFRRVLATMLIKDQVFHRFKVADLIVFNFSDEGFEFSYGNIPIHGESLVADVTISQEEAELRYVNARIEETRVSAGDDLKGANP
jgi:hypothetical protein